MVDCFIDMIPHHRFSFFFSLSRSFEMMLCSGLVVTNGMT